MKNSPILNTDIFEQPSFAITSEPANTSYKANYFRFLNQSSREAQIEAQHFIETQLDKVVMDENELPTDYEDLKIWITQHAEQVGQQYHEYLLDRKNGQPRRLFKNKSHALNFIKLVAPTKMVDGSWLHGFIHHADNEKFSKLVSIYLDELGNGDVHKNHVVLFRQLLTKYGFEELNQLSDEFFLQGAIQLALGCNAEAFTPEIIGFNLAYEQLPLHLMITAYELRELNIDPYYFTLHVTVDNALTGHSKMAIDAFRDSLPDLANQKDYIQRVTAGMALNQDGLSTMSIIESYEIEEEIVEIFKQKSTLGQYMHGDHCAIGGKTVNMWLENPENIPEFIQALESNRWINRNEDPKNSRFWRLIEGDKASMYGVFNAYEKQVIYDWIAGDALENLPRAERLGLLINRNVVTAGHTVNSHALNETNSQATDVIKSNIIKMELGKKSLAVHAKHSNSLQNFAPMHEFNPTEDEALFKQKVSKAKSRQELMHLLTEWMSPAKHHTHLGLLATQLFIEQLDAAR